MNAPSGVFSKLSFSRVAIRLLKCPAKAGVIVRSFLILQAKSKRLTIESRKGNDKQLRLDFQKSVQDAYDQGLQCAQLIQDCQYALRHRSGEPLLVSREFREIYLLCVVSDHYPALSFQVRHFLKYQDAETICPPFVLDVFTLDVMAEMLASPLRLLSYIERRSKYGDRLLATHEMNILALHLRQNLWMSDKPDLMMIEDDVSAELDVAMGARREGIPGNRTPKGILTRLQTTALGRIISDIEASPDPGIIDFGVMLLTLSGDTIVSVSQSIEAIARQARIDGQRHDLSILTRDGSVGLTVHVSTAADEIAMLALEGHCALRKYRHRIKLWYGVCLEPRTLKVRFGVNLDFPWERNAKMSALVKNLSEPVRDRRLLRPKVLRPRAISRNDLCPCGSGKKFKKCCFRKNR